MQVRSGAIARRSHECDRLPRGHDVARLDERPIEVGIERAELGVALDHDVEAVPAALPVHRHQARGRGTDRGIEWRGQVNATMEVAARACRRPWLDLEGRTPERLRQGGVVHRHEKRAHRSLLGLHHHAGHQERHPEEPSADRKQWPAPGPGEERDTSRGQHRYALDARAVAPIAPLTARLASPSASPGTLIKR